MRSLRWRIAESVFLIAGLALLDWYIWSRAGAVVYQAYESYIFRGRLREEQKAPPPVTPMPAPPRLHRNDLVGRLEIPRLGIRVMVHEGDDHGVLAAPRVTCLLRQCRAAGQRCGGRASRHVFPAAARHPRERQNRLHHAERDVRISGGVVEEREPDDVSVLKASAEPTLTLVTCYPFYYVGSAPHRFIVRARQVGSSPPRVEEASLHSRADPAASGRPGRGPSPSPAVSASTGRRHRRS
jgi:sortase A